MAYLNNSAAAAETTTALVPTASTTDSLIKLVKDLSPIILLIVIVWLLMREEEAAPRRPNPRWKSLPEWKSQEPADSRRATLKRLIGQQGYKTVLKRLVAMANLSGNASAKADTNWMQQEFGA